VILEKYTMFDGKEIAIQVIDDQSEEQRDDHYLVMIKEWDPQTWIISDPKEIYIKKTTNL
jgi:hypothetical protein